MITSAAIASTLSFDTVTAMKAYTSSTAGVTSINVLGYAAVNDGGKATYVPATGTFYSQSMLVTTKDGAQWMVGDNTLALEKFGGFADNTTDCTQAMSTCLLYGKAIYLGSGTYKFMGSPGVEYSQMRDPKVEIYGKGMGLTVLNLANTAPYLPGIRINNSGSSTPNLTTTRMSGFSIGRDNPDGYTGIIGPKSLWVRYSSNVVIDGIEEYGAIGFGIAATNCYVVTIRNCIVRDHKGGSAHLSGTDGIDVWYGAHNNVYNNTIYNIGDDAISFVGNNTTPVNDNHATNNVITNCAGSVKLFGSSFGTEIGYNAISNCLNGGVTLWTDATQTEAGSITSVNIHDNTITSCGGAGATGGITINATGGSYAQVIDNVTIDNNTINNSPKGISIFSAAPAKLFSRVYVTNNLISGCGTGILAGAVKTSMTMSGNYVQNSTAEGIAIALNNVNSVGMGAGTFSITGNTVTDFMGGHSGYAVRPGGLSIGSGTPSDFTVSDNSISNTQSPMAYYGIYSLIAMSKAALLASNPGIDLSTTKGVYSGAP